MPAGRFTMGSPANELGHGSQEGPQHWVTFAQQFAVGEFALTFEEWEACIVDGGCNGYRPPDRGWGRGRLPVINVSWDDVRSYVAWLSKKTGKTYRLLSEAEREYVTRAGTTTAYWWGDEIGKGNANCNGCGSQWEQRPHHQIPGIHAIRRLSLSEEAMHSAGSSARMYEPTLRCSPSIVRSAALRSHVFSGWNNNSIGLRSGEYGGK